MTEAPTTEPRELLDWIGDAYLAVPIGAPAVASAMVRSPAVSKVYAGRYPAAVDLRETHETLLADFCYRVSTYIRANRREGHSVVSVTENRSRGPRSG